MSAVDIVPLRIESSDALADVHGRCMATADAWTGPGLKRLLSAEAARGFQAEAEGGIVGFVLAFAAADESEVLAICVAPEHRRSGVGHRLLKTLERELAAQHITRLHLEARASNFAARELYRRAGFHETGRRKAYYQATDDMPAEDAVLMSKSIGPG